MKKRRDCLKDDFFLSMMRLISKNLVKSGRCSLAGVLFWRDGKEGRVEGIYVLLKGSKH